LGGAEIKRLQARQLDNLRWQAAQSVTEDSAITIVNLAKYKSFELGQLANFGWYLSEVFAR